MINREIYHEWSRFDKYADSPIHESVLFIKEESPLDCTTYKSRLLQYADSTILKNFGLSFEQWLDQPRWKIEAQLEIALKLGETETDVLDEIKAEMGEIDGR